MLWKYNGSEFITRYYNGNYEMQKLKLLGVTATSHIHYIHGIDGIAAIIERDQTGSDHYYYTYTDNLGSILTLTNASGAVIAEQSFDAWGRKRNPTDWSYSNIPNVPIWLYRGFTGHEDLTAACGLINMNGRLYDPILGRMLRPDNYVQLPYSTQSYNRYSYCVNNPLKYSDPTGQMFFGADAIIFGICLGVTVGSFTGAVIADLNGKPMWQGFIFGGLIGAASSMLSSLSPLAGISAIPSFVSTTVWGAAVGSASGAAFAAATGSNVKQGAMYGAIFGAATGFLSSEEMVNVFRGQGFASNEKVLGNFRAENCYQEALDYFGFKGDFDPYNIYWQEAPNADAITVNKGPIAGRTFYREGAFTRYDRLKMISHEELLHRSDIFAGKTNNITWEQYQRLEWRHSISNYRNQGLWLNHNTDIIKNINTYGLGAGVYTNQINFISGTTELTRFEPKWWHFLFKIGRRW